MKKLIGLTVAIVLLLVSALGVQAAGTGTQISASILRYEPTPAEQGNTVDLWIQFSNAGTASDYGKIRFTPEYPFSLPAGQIAEVDVGMIAATESKVVKYTVFIDPDAPNGDRNVTFMYKFTSADAWLSLEAPITLQTQNAVLVIDNYKVTPFPVVPGQTAKIELELRNAGRIAIKNINVNLDLKEDFSTIGSGTKKRIDYIDFGENAFVTFELVSDPSTKVKVYNVQVTLSYQDERNKQYSDSITVSMVLNAEPELSLTVDATDFKKKTDPGTVSVKIVNKGIVDLKYVSVRLGKDPSYDILSPSREAYVGNLDNDDFETFDFVIKPNVESPRLQLQVEFKNPYNVDYTQNYQLPLRIVTEAELGKKRSPIGIIAVAVLVIGGIIYWRMRRKKKRR